MHDSFWKDWYAVWGWFLLIGIWILMISIYINWNQSNRSHRYLAISSQKSELDVLNERNAKSKISQR